MKEKYLTITQLSRYLKYKFEQDVNLNTVYLKGEISNFKAHTRGHYYFTLKDEGSRINAIMFQSNVKNCKFMPMDGMKVMVTGRVSVYEATGGYQIYVSDMQENGVGNLYIAYEQLKKKLELEGLFDASRKRKIVRMPKRIGIVTASTGAAIRDILTTLKRRYPLAETILFPALVQGANAGVDIARKIEIANTYDIDTLIVGRGGGSIEDLWPFNEEVVARAIYHSRVPVISAVGHEIDFTIADFVADLRAPTPTAAAELAVVDINTVIDYLEKVRTRSYQAIGKKIQLEKAKLESLSESYVLKRPSNIYEIKEQKLDMLLDKINGDIQKILENTRLRLFKSTNSYVLSNPSLLYFQKEKYFQSLYQRLNKEMEIILTNKRTDLFVWKNHYILNNPDLLYKFHEQKLNGLVEKLMVLNPMNTLKRGYAIVRTKRGVVSSVLDVSQGECLTVQFKNGEVIANVLERRENGGKE